jgi:hypothetical protein
METKERDRSTLRIKNIFKPEFFMTEVVICHIIKELYASNVTCIICVTLKVS